MIRLALVAVSLVAMVTGLEDKGLQGQESAASGPGDKPASTSEPPALEQIQNRLAQLQADTSLTAANKQNLVTLYEAIITELKARADHDKQTKELYAKAAAAPTATLELKNRQENPPARDLVSANALRSYQLPALQSLLQAQQSLLQTAADGRAKTEAEIKAREASKKELPRLIAEDRAALKKLQEKLVAVPGAEPVDQVLREAESQLLKAQLAAMAEKIKKNEQALRTIEAEAELLPLRKAMFIADERYYGGRVKEINDELYKRRETIIQGEQDKAAALASEAPVELKWLANRLVARAQDWLELAKHNSALQFEIEQAEARRNFWEERDRIMTDRSRSHRSQLFGSIHSLNGLILRRHRSELPDEGKLKKQLSEMLQQMQQTETLIIELEDWKNENADTAITDLKATSNLEGGLLAAPSIPVGLSPQADRLLLAERELVSNFTMDAKNYSDNLYRLAEVKQATLDVVRKYRTFIDQHILWVPSAKPVAESDLRNVWPAVQYVFDARKWWEAGRQLLTDLRDRVWQPLLFLGLWSSLLFYTSRMRRGMFALGELAGRPTMVAFWPTAQAILYCLLLAAPVSLLMAWLGYRLQQAASPQTFTHALGLGALVAARYFYPLELIRQICRSGGLAEKHFEWPTTATSLLRKHLRWLIDLGVPAVFLGGLLFNLGENRYEHALGRVAFIALMILCGLFFGIVFRPRSGVLGEYLECHRGGWLERLRYLWYAVLVIGPLSLAIMSLTGFHYTAIRLSMLSHTTLITLTGLFLCHQIIHRWLWQSRRRLITEQARQRLEGVQTRELDPLLPSSAAGGGARVDRKAPEYPLGAQVVDLAEMNAQSLSLAFSILVVVAILSVGYIWSGVLPAVNALNAIQLWTVQGNSPTEQTPITLADLLVAIPILVITYVASKNLPGLLEFALLQRLPLENASRYAIASISRYLIMLVGVFLTLNTIGVRWVSIQWLVAALGVGLGFGLQEIFANFVSGLILLFEQPIRVGDVITLGDMTGAVSRIRMRATTITNWDRQELIIPNKDLVTGRLLNWTLSDSTNRSTITIGVPQGTDTDLACRLIREICQHHPNVMSDPPATAHVDSFQEGMVTIVVRLFQEKLDYRLDTRHEIFTEIARRFGEAGIELALPQRELHLRSLPTAMVEFLTKKGKP
jgi:potassium efflux system protein